MKRVLLALLFLLAGAGIADAQIASEIANGGGTAGAITAGVGSGTAGRVPQFASATSVVDSKVLTSGTNSGTWTLYDNTATSGLSKLVLRLGEDQSDDAFSSDHPFADLLSAAGSSLTSGYGLFGWGGVDGLVLNVNGIQDANGHDGFSLVGSYGGATPMLSLRSNGVINWSSDASYDTKDVGLSRSAAGILKVTDGSTGSGGIGISDTATNTVTDALILRHATSDAGFGQDGFGTGLLFQAENDVGTMHDMARLSAVYSDSADGSEDADVELFAMKAGTLTGGLTLSSAIRGANPGIHNKTGALSIEAALDINIGVINGRTIVFQGYDTGGWWGITGTALFPWSTNSFDLGQSDKFVKDSYLGTSIQGTRTQAISAEGGGGTEFVEIAVASGASVGGFIEYTVQADDGTDREIESGVVSFTATNEAGTEAANVSILGTPAETPGAALTVSFDVTTGLTNVFRVKVISDSPALVPTTHKIEYRVHVNSGTTTVTPLT